MALRRPQGWTETARYCLEQHEGGRTYRELAEELGWYRRNGKPSRGRVEHVIRDYRIVLKQSVKIAVRRQKPQRPDEERWHDAVADLTRRNHITVAHLSDTHRPYQDEDALELAYQVLEYLKPDLVVDLSDGFDFPTISTFKQDPDIPNYDILETVTPLWFHHQDRLDATLPRHCVRRGLMGNHDERLQRFLMETAPQIRKTVLHTFDEVVRAQGRVIFPDYLSEIHVGPLTVIHGDKSSLGMYGPKRQLEARRFQRFLMAGHSHHPGYYLARGPEHAVASIVGGCLSLPPHYVKNTTYNTWTQGFAYAVVDVKAHYAWLHNVVFERTETMLKTSVGNRIFCQELSSDSLALAA